MILQPRRVEKSWGYELWIHNDSQYCGKLLVFTKAGNHFSMHYHMIKNETWYKLQCYDLFTLFDVYHGGPLLFNTNVMINDCDLYNANY
jgi:hypothetical protein